jgi:sulfate transport system ATP-binding protein
MGFLGEVARLDGRLVRPHDLVLHPDPVPGAHEAMVERVAHLGFEVRVELSLAAEGEAVTAQLTRDAVRALELRRGDVVWVSGAGAPRPDFAPALTRG